MDDFFALPYDLLFRNAEVANELYSNNLYALSGIISFVLAFLCPVIYYFGMDKTRYSGRLYWLSWLGANALICYLCAVFLSKNSLDKKGLYFAIADYLYFGIVVLLYNLILFFIVSLILKRFTTNLARTPF